MKEIQLRAKKALWWILVCCCGHGESHCEDLEVTRMVPLRNTKDCKRNVSFLPVKLRLCEQQFNNVLEQSR